MTFQTGVTEFAEFVGSVILFIRILIIERITSLSSDVRPFPVSEENGRVI